jgi:hypothetical protein
MFTVEYVKDLVWCDADHTFFSCVVKYEEFNEEMPCGVNSVDSYAHIQEIWTKANAGEYGVISEYVPPPPFDPNSIVAVVENGQLVTNGTQNL